MAVVLNDKTSGSQQQAQATDDSSGNNICRIVVDPEVERQIVLDELSVDSTQMETDEDTDANTRSNKKVAGREFPVIRIKDFIIDPTDVKMMNIEMDDRIPTISLTIRMKDTSFRSKNMPNDGDIISVFIAPKTDTLVGIRSDFVIVGSTVPKSNLITLTGKLFVPSFEAESTFGFVGTSKTVFKETAKKYGLGFAIDDMDDTTDKQLWICPSIRPIRFLNETILHTWKDNTSFFDWWIDLYYNLNFINVNKIILENKSEVDLTAAGTQVGGGYDTATDYSQDNTKAAAKLFTNISDAAKGSFFVKSWTVYNESTEISFDDGVEIVTDEFVHNANLYGGTSEDKVANITELSNIPAYDPENMDDYIILRGRAEYNKDTNPEKELARANYNYKDIYIRRPWAGVSYVMSDDDTNEDDTTTWSGNVNKNYTRAPYHNKINIDELNKLYIKIKVGGICSQVMRGEVVPVILKKDQTELATNGAQQQAGMADKFYNGFYYVSAISYEFKQGNPMEFTTELTLKRREWPIPVDYKKDK